MNIITISREFGSGGRELGKRLADYLGVPCYDYEIIDIVAKKLNMDKTYVHHISKKDVRILPRFHRSSLPRSGAGFSRNGKSDLGTA